MKIAILINELDIRGGTHKQVLRFDEYLRSKNCETRLFTKTYSQEHCYEGFKHCRVISASQKHGITRKGNRAKRFCFSIFCHICLFFKIRRFNPDVINIHDNGFLFLFFLLKLTSPNKIYIWQINDLPAAFRAGASKYHKEKPWHPYLRSLYVYMASLMNRITVNVTKNKLLVENLLSSTATVLYCGVDCTNNYYRERKRKHPSHESILELVTIGVFFPYRNYEIIIRSQHTLQSIHGINTRLRIIGSYDLSQEYCNSIRHLAKELNVDIEVMGDVSDNELQTTLNSSDIFLFVNIDQSWGLSVFEAMNMGLPVIVSESVGAVELLHNGVDSEFIDPRSPDDLTQKIIKFVSDPDLYSSRSKAGFELTKSLTWDALYSSRALEIFKHEYRKNRFFKIHSTPSDEDKKKSS